MKRLTCLCVGLILALLALADSPAPTPTPSPTEPEYAIAVTFTRFLSEGSSEGFDLKCPLDEKHACEARSLRGATATETKRLPLGDAQKIVRGFSSKLPKGDVHADKPPKEEPFPGNSVVTWSVDAKGNYSRGFVPPPEHKLEPVLRQRMKAIIFLESRLRSIVSAQ
jgi:hypothetical protein